MAQYIGSWRVMPANPRFPEQQPTRYLRAQPTVVLEVREQIQNWCDYVRTLVDESAASIKFDEPLLTPAQARTRAWLAMDRNFSTVHEIIYGYPRTEIGNDPRVYTIREMISFAERELAARRDTGQLKDIKASIIDRHNWMVIMSGWTHDGGRLTDRMLAWIDQRAIDIIDVGNTVGHRLTPSWHQEDPRLTELFELAR